ncbi:MAG: tRNA pseudouridine(55) synthase TruB [Alphaproteobacteria bacterium]|nr:tRNA pseudouridine(55) synthase TruB [Alphaproteobacteria bacterium]
MLNGWINLHKPENISSNDALSQIKRTLRAQYGKLKIGHAGTLDPLASGVLPLALGEATKAVHFMQDSFKTYLFTVKWGESTSTDDREGEIIATSPKIPTQEEIEKIIPEFLGDIMQAPPQYSAIKVDGERAYKLAREGVEVEMQKRPVYVDSLVITENKGSETTLRLTSGKGFYVRSLARDLAHALGTEGHISYLCREEVGHFSLKNAISLDFFDKNRHEYPPEQFLLPLMTVLDDIPALAVDIREAGLLRRGQVLQFISRSDYARLTPFSEYAETIAHEHGKPVAIVTFDGPSVKPARVFNV